jgi:hypothetical protein
MYVPQKTIRARKLCLHSSWAQDRHFSLYWILPVFGFMKKSHSAAFFLLREFMSASFFNSVLLHAFGVFFVSAPRKKLGRDKPRPNFFSLGNDVLFHAFCIPHTPPVIGSIGFFSRIAAVRADGR